MSEQDQRLSRSPLESERGKTYIKDSVVSKIASMAAGEVEGTRMGGSASRATRGILQGVTGSQGLSSGVSVEVGRIETAIDVTMGIEYGRNILQLAERVRDRVTERVESLTGLQVTELNVTISDVVFPSQVGGREERGRGVLRSEPRDEDQMREQRTEKIGVTSHERETADTEPIGMRGGALASTEVVHGPGDREEVRAERTPLEEDVPADLRPVDEESERDRRRER